MEQSQDKEAQLKSKIKKKYPFLNDEEIAAFFSSHSWLANETDDKIVEDFLYQYHLSLYERHKSICENIKLVNEGKYVEPSMSDSRMVQEEEEKQEKQNVEKMAEEINRKMEEEDKFGDCLMQAEQIQEEFQAKPDILVKILTFLEERLGALIKNPKDEFSRQMTLKVAYLKAESVRKLVEKIGYNVIDLGDEILAIYDNAEIPEHVKDMHALIQSILQELRSNSQVLATLQANQRAKPDQNYQYNPNNIQFQWPEYKPQPEQQQQQQPQQQQMVQPIYQPQQQQIPVQQQPILDPHTQRANMLAAIHENRVNRKTSKPNPSINQNINPNMIANTNANQLSTQPNPQSQNNDVVFGINLKEREQNWSVQQAMKDQISEYRERMRERQRDNNRFTGNNIMRLEDLEMTSIPKGYYSDKPLTDNPADAKTFKSRFVTTRDIEEMRIAEEMVAFGKFSSGVCEN